MTLTGLIRKCVAPSVLFSLLAVWSGGANAQVDAARSGTAQGDESASPLRQRIRLDVAGDGDIAIVATDRGLEAVSAQTGQRMVLDAEEPQWLAVDPLAGVVWLEYQKEDGFRSLAYLDLDGDAAGPYVVVRGAPVPFRVLYPGRLQLRSDAHFGYAAELVLASSGPRLKLAEGIYAYMAETEVPEQIQKLTMENQDRLVALIARAAERAVEIPASRGESRVSTVSRRNCEEQSLCGKCVLLPSRLTPEEFPLARVIVGHSCGDGCYVDYRLYDTSREVYLDPRKPSAAFTDPKDAPALVDFWLPYSGKAWITGGEIVSLDHGALQDVKARGDGAGWLDGGSEITGY